MQGTWVPSTISSKVDGWVKLSTVTFPSPPTSSPSQCMLAGWEDATSLEKRGDNGRRGGEGEEEEKRWGKGGGEEEEGG